MRFRLLAVVAAVALSSVHAPAQAATGVLTLSGARTASVSMVLKAPGTLDLSHFTPDPTAAWSGLVLRDAEGTLLSLAVQVRSWAAAPFPPAPLVTRDGPLTLRAGTYRLELLSPGPATVRVAATGAAVRTLRAQGPSRANVTLRDLRTQGLPVADLALPATLDAKGALVLAFFERATAHQLSVPQLCFADPGAPTCASALGFTSVLASAGSVGDGWVQSFTAAYGGDGLDGRHDAKVQDVTVDVPRVLDALLVQV